MLMRWLCLPLQPMSMACFWKPLLPLVSLESKSADLSPGHLHIPFLCHLAWTQGCPRTHGCPYWWIYGSMAMELKNSSRRMVYSLVMVWLWRWMVLPRCLLDDGQWILVNMDWSLWSVGLSDHPLELGEPGPFICPFAASVDSGLSDVWHFSFFSWHAEQSAFSASSVVIIMFAAVFYMIVFLLLYVVFCRDDISFRQFTFAFYIFTFDTWYHILSFSLL